MGYKPWYERMAEMDSVSEQQEFMRGAFSGAPENHEPIIAGLIAGYIGGKIASRKNKDR